MKRLHAIVAGRVQGVGFRYFVRHTASGLGLAGYVKNLSDGDVEVVAEGSRDALDELLEKLRKGPAMSNVTDVTEDFEERKSEFSGFDVWY